MRTPILAAALGLSLVGCLIGDSGTPGSAGDDDDGSNSGSNGPGSGPGSNQNTPKVDVTVDKMAISTELLSTNLVTVTVRGSGGFAGPVALAVSAVDGTGTAIPGWTVALDKTTVDVPANGTATAVATVTIPSRSTAMSASIKVDSTSSLGAKSVSPQVTVAKQISLTMNIVDTTCGKFASPALTVAPGTNVRWVNGDAAKRITIHVQPQTGSPTGFTHEDNPGMAPLGTYETVALAAGQVTWYCHAPGNDDNRYTLTVAP
jgi:plastocyanin